MIHPAVLWYVSWHISCIIHAANQLEHRPATQQHQELSTLKREWLDIHPTITFHWGEDCLSSTAWLRNSNLPPPTVSPAKFQPRNTASGRTDSRQRHRTPDVFGLFTISWNLDFSSKSLGLCLRICSSVLTRVKTQFLKVFEWNYGIPRKTRRPKYFSAVLQKSADLDRDNLMVCSIHMILCTEWPMVDFYA